MINRDMKFLLSPIPTVDICKMINKVLKWTLNWQMEFNPKNVNLSGLQKEAIYHIQSTYYIVNCPFQEVPLIE